MTNANLVIKFEEKEHSHFRRTGDNLIYTEKITLADSLNSRPVKVKSLDGRTLTQCFDELISPQTCRCVEGEGMPVSGTKERGDLYIRFDIEFPKMSNG